MMESACALSAASDGPARLTPATVEWHDAQPGGVARKSASPWATGESDAAAAGALPLVSPLPGKVPPLTRIGRGGQPWLSILETQPRKAITWAISSSLSLGLGISRRCCCSE